jgi:hypothetical protein
MMPPNSPVRIEYKRGECLAYVIPNGETSGPVIDLYHNYRVISIQIERGTPIPSSTNMEALVDWGCGLMVALYEQDDPETQWVKTLPNFSQGSCGFILTHTFGIRQIRFALSNPTTGDATFFIMGHDMGERAS